MSQVNTILTSNEPITLFGKFAFVLGLHTDRVYGCPYCGRGFKKVKCINLIICKHCKSVFRYKIIKGGDSNVQMHT